VNFHDAASAGSGFGQPPNISQVSPRIESTWMDDQVLPRRPSRQETQVLTLQHSGRIGSMEALRALLPEIIRVAPQDRRPTQAIAVYDWVVRPGGQCRCKPWRGGICLQRRPARSDIAWLGLRLEDQFEGHAEAGPTGCA